MSELFGVFKQHLVWSLMLWLIVFTAFTAVFARGQLTALTKGLGRLLLSIVASPFIFLRRATSGVLGFTAEEEDEYRKGDQYLLSKAMMVVQALIIVVAIGALAAAVVATWNTLVPPADVRREAREYRPKVDEQRIAASNAAQAVMALDQAWTAKEPAVMEQFRNQRQAAINDASRDMKHIETTIETHGSGNAKSVLSQIRQRAANATSSRDGARYAKSSMNSIVSNYWYWLEDWSRNSLNQWASLWLEQMNAQIELNQTTAAELRQIEQPEHVRAVARSEAEADTLQSMVRTQEHLDEAASLKWKRAALTAGGAFVTILLFLWIAGLLVEGGWLAIRVAGDVRRLRESAETQTKPLLETTAFDVRLPIRPQVANPQRV
jgi:hypothetical protein